MRFFIISFLLIFSLLIFSCSSSDYSNPNLTIIGPVGGHSGSSGVGGSAGTSNDGGTGGSEVKSPKECTVFELAGSFELVNAVEGIGSIIMAETNQTEEGKSTLLMIEFYQFSAPQEEGLFDLAAVPDDNYETRDRCLRVITLDTEAGTPPDKVFFQRSGKLNLIKADSVGNGESQGEIERLELVEVSIDPYSYRSEEVNDPDCVIIEPLSWGS